jgi:hypothetical protein
MGLKLDYNLKMLFDPDEYVENKLDTTTSAIETLIRPPNNKVAATNLLKLAPDRKIVHIKVRSSSVVLV